MNSQRFIAGVVCPACDAADTTAIRDAGSLRVRVCVVCGHRETLVAREVAAVREGAVHEEAVIRLIDPARNESGSQ